MILSGNNAKSPFFWSPCCELGILSTVYNHTIAGGRMQKSALISGFLPGLWSRSPSSFGGLEPEPKNFEWWSRSLKFGFPFNGHGLWSEPIVQIIQWFLVFNGPNRSGAGAKNFRCLELEPKIWVPAPQPWFLLKSQQPLLRLLPHYISFHFDRDPYICSEGQMPPCC